jgi:hypothetical protein
MPCVACKAKKGTPPALRSPTCWIVAEREAQRAKKGTFDHAGSNKNGQSSGRRLIKLETTQLSKEQAKKPITT